MKSQSLLNELYAPSSVRGWQRAWFFYLHRLVATFRVAAASPSAKHFGTANVAAVSLAKLTHCFYLQLLMIFIKILLKLIANLIDLSIGTTPWNF